MTAKAAVRQAEIERAIRAAQRLGLRIAGVRPDGTVIISDGETPPIAVDQVSDERAKCRSPR